MVLKIAPPPSVTMMRHEKDILKTEAMVLKLIERKTTIRAPRLIAWEDSCTICEAPYFFMTWMEGTALSSLKRRPEEAQVMEMKREIGRFCRQLCDIPAKQFGISAMPETYTDNNCDFIKELFHMLFQDAAERKIYVPDTTEEKMLGMLERERDVLNEAESPCFIHTDTWDGNLMVKDGTLVGLIDFAAVLYGDPLMSHDFHDFSDQPAFLEGFGKKTFTLYEEIRISIYKIWQRLGMIVERGYRGYEDSNTYAWVLRAFSDELMHLKQLIKQ